MDIEIKDTITLSDDNHYVVVGKIIQDGNTYYYLIDEDNNENVKFCVEKSENNSFIEIENVNLIQQLLPLFLQSASNAITKEEWKLIDTNNNNSES